MKQMCKIIKSDAITRRNKITKWSPAANDVLKLNVDGAIFHEQGATGVGLVCVIISVGRHIVGRAKVKHFSVCVLRVL